MLEDDELVGILSLNLVDELDDVAVTVLAKVLGAQVRQLILGLNKVDADLALLHQLLPEEVPHRNVLCARAVGAVAGDVLSMYSGALPNLSSKPSSNIVLKQNTASFILRAATTSSTSIVDCAVNPYSPILNLFRALASIAMYDEVDLLLSGLLP